MSGDTHTSNRFKWLEAITADGRLHSTAIRVAVVIASHLNRKTGEAFPSIKTIAAKSATPERSVERAIAELCKAGYLERRRGGFSQPNRYAIPESSPHHASVEAADIPATDGGTDGDSPAMGGGNDNISTAADGGSFPPLVAAQSRHGWRTNPLIEPIEKEPIELESISRPRQGMPRRKVKEADANFEAFFEAYPRKVSKGTARKAWGKAVEQIDPAVIIAGAQRYAQERRGEDPRFTKHPATWLNAEAWQDEPSASTGGTIRPPHGAHGSAKDRTAAALRHMLANEEDAA